MAENENQTPNNDKLIEELNAKIERLEKEINRNKHEESITKKIKILCLDTFYMWYHYWRLFRIQDIPPS